ncbi:MAG: HAMP domain-containing protein [Betaproteobacteria bacterium]|nr:HAMP domain-containing protein [Betaproteobacteria bacterium]
MQYALIVTLGLGALALYVLSLATANSELFSRHYPILLLVNGALVLALFGLVGFQLWNLLRRLRTRVFGAKLTLRLVVMFAFMAVVPGILIYALSVQFLVRSIDSWFDVQVDRAMDSSLRLGRSALDSLLKDLANKADAIAFDLSETPQSDQTSALNQLRERIGAQEATLFNQRGTIIAFSSSERANLAPDVPSAAVLRRVRVAQSYSAVESIPGKGLQLRVVVPVAGLGLGQDIRMLQLLQPVPDDIAADADTVQGMYRDYQELLLSRVGLKRLYGVTLTLALLLALLSALAVAFYLSERLSAPLGVLAEGTRAVAQGNLSEQLPVPSRDELGVLTQSFNAMTRQLADARAAVERNQAQLETAKAYIESTLANLSAGVLAFDEALTLRASNVSAGAILEIDAESLKGISLFEWGSADARLAPFSDAVRVAFEEAGAREWEKQVEHRVHGGERVLLVRGTRFQAADATGCVVVFDDITHLLQAQRDAAWAEVARRLAHEIKNPLTPIQLSAERLQRKLHDKLGALDAEMLDRATRTIVNQVMALKGMVDAFSQYARSPEATLQSMDVNQLVREILTLYDAMGSHIRAELAPRVDPVFGHPGQIRQLVHNLLQNAQDAVAGSSDPRILIRTEQKEATLCLSIEDNGSGFPDGMMGRVFEPYVTTKPKGTGLGLAIVKKIVEEHGGKVEIENLRPRGAAVHVTLPLFAARPAARKSEAKA